jgi:hypothetical protein
MTGIKQNDSLEEEIYELLTFYCTAAASDAKNEARMAKARCSPDGLLIFRSTKVSEPCRQHPKADPLQVWVGLARLRPVCSCRALSFSATRSYEEPLRFSGASHNSYCRGLDRDSKPGIRFNRGAGTPTAPKD